MRLSMEARPGAVSFHRVETALVRCLRVKRYGVRSFAAATQVWLDVGAGADSRSGVDLVY
jgi:hypothetical protein